MSSSHSSQRYQSARAARISHTAVAEQLYYVTLGKHLNRTAVKHKALPAINDAKRKRNGAR